MIDHKEFIDTESKNQGNWVDLHRDWKNVNHTFDIKSMYAKAGWVSATDWDRGCIALSATAGDRGSTVVLEIFLFIATKRTELAAQ